MPKTSNAMTTAQLTRALCILGLYRGRDLKAQCDKTITEKRVAYAYLIALVAFMAAVTTFNWAYRTNTGVTLTPAMYLDALEAEQHKVR
jgi:hypothetical protein